MFAGRGNCAVFVEPSERFSVPRPKDLETPFILDCASMSHSSASELEKEGQKGFEDKNTPDSQLTEAQEHLVVEAGTRPFTEKDDVERNSEAEGVEGERDGEGALSRVSSRPSVNNIKSVPNGGLRAWLQVLSSFFVFFNVSVAVMERGERHFANRV